MPPPRTCPPVQTTGRVLSTTPAIAGGLAVAALIATLACHTRAFPRRAIPDPRAHHQLVYHAGQGRVLLIGGSTRRGDRYHYFDEMWFWDGNGWKTERRLPFPRSSHRVVHHAARNSLVMFGGGFGQAVRADGVLWEWRSGDWKVIGGDRRAGSDEPGICYDQKRGLVVIFGGWDASAAYRSDTWEWSGADLLRVDTAGPSPRAGHAFLFDPVRQRCLLFGGRGSDGYCADTWEWDGETWRRLDVAGPSARWFPGSATDPRYGRIIIFGGRGPDAQVRGRDGAGDLGDTWEWNGERWIELSTDGPSARSAPMLAFTGRAVLLFGGREERREGFQDLNDTWELEGREWARRR